MFTVYVLFSRAYQRIYIGYSSDFEKRLKSHNELGTKGWTIRYRPWELVHKELFASKVDALRREKELKTAKGREWIWQQIITQ